MKKIFFVMGILGMLSSSALPVTAASVEKVGGFVCPVFNSNAVGMHNPNAVPISGGDYTIIGPNVSVPIHATNQNGAGSPGGEHARPGDKDYTPLWAL